MSSPMTNPTSGNLATVSFDRGDLHLDVTVPGAQFVALVGANGAGKTTVLRCLAGLEPAAVLVWGTDVRTFGYLPQRVSLYPAMSLEDNVASSLRFAGTHRTEAVRRARELLDLVDIADLAARRPHEVSGGQRQRAGLARAIAADPSLLLLDEPFSAIDVSSRSVVRQRVIDHIKASKSRCVIATHDDADTAAAQATRVDID